MNKKLFRCLAMTLIGMMVWGGSALAASNPDPLNWNDDSDVELFVPTSTLLTVEIADVPDLLPGFSSEFGFFFSGADLTNSDNLIPIFTASDITLPNQVSSQIAVVDFVNDRVVDMDDGATLEGTFVTSAGSIGFYYTLYDLKGELATLFTTTLYNSVGDVGTFASKGLTATYLLSFYFPVNGSDQIFALEFVSGVTAAPVPEPSTMLLFFAGVIGALGLERKKLGWGSR